MSAHAGEFLRESDQALLQCLIGTRESRRLYQGSLTSLFSQREAVGRGPAKLLAAQELVRRALKEQLRQRSVLSSPATVRDFLALMLGGKQHEVFVVLFLDAQNALISADELFRGTLTQTSVYPREVVKESLRHNAAGVILAHNHPSGCATPSRADEHLTQALKSALALVDVRVLDHVIVGQGQTLSFAERGLL